MKSSEKHHELIARGVIVENGRLLVNRSRNAKTGEEYCALPGGHVDAGESCMEAVRREIEEELDCETDIGELLFVTESVYAGRHHDDGRRQEVVLYFAATLKNEPRENADGTLQSPEADKNFAWLALADLPDANLLPHAAKEFLLQKNAALYSFHDATNGAS